MARDLVVSKGCGLEEQPPQVGELPHLEEEHSAINNSLNGYMNVFQRVPGEHCVFDYGRSTGRTRVEQNATREQKRPRPRVSSEPAVFAYQVNEGHGILVFHGYPAACFTNLDQLLRGPSLSHGNDQNARVC